MTDSIKLYKINNNTNLDDLNLNQTQIKEYLQSYDGTSVEQYLWLVVTSDFTGSLPGIFYQLSPKLINKKDLDIHGLDLSPKEEKDDMKISFYLKPDDFSKPMDYIFYFSTKRIIITLGDALIKYKIKDDIMNIFKKGGIAYENFSFVIKNLVLNQIIICTQSFLITTSRMVAAKKFVKNFKKDTEMNMKIKNKWNLFEKEDSWEKKLTPVQLEILESHDIYQNRCIELNENIERMCLSLSDYYKYRGIDYPFEECRDKIKGAIVGIEENMNKLTKSSWSIHNVIISIFFILYVLVDLGLKFVVEKESSAIKGKALAIVGGSFSALFVITILHDMFKRF